MQNYTEEHLRYPIFSQELAPPKPFLVLSFDDEIVEVLPSQKANQKIAWDENVVVVEIENRYELEEYADDGSEEGDYQIEIVEDGSDADFYLEIVDGEVYYVFETEDDLLSCDSDYSSEDYESDSYTESTPGHHQEDIQLPIDSTMPPILNENSDKDSKFAGSSTTSAQTAVTEGKIFSETEIPSQLPSSEISLGTNSNRQEAAKHCIASNGSVDDPATVSPSTASPKKVDNVALPMTPPSSPTKSILRACEPSPVKKNVKPKRSSKKKKTFTKTYIQAENFDGEHQVYTWKKPDWTEKKLKSTKIGEQMKNSGNLANPITFPKKKPANHDVVFEETNEGVNNEEIGVNKEELIRRLKGGDEAVRMMVPLPKTRRSQRRLKFSLHGAKIRDGGDIAKPISNINARKEKNSEHNVNHVANQEVLKKTHIGDKVRKGITAVEKKSYSWEKPSWVETKLRTSADEAEKEKKYRWEKPEWAKRNSKQVLIEKKVLVGPLPLECAGVPR